MSEKGNRKPVFTDIENTTIAQFYRENLDVFRCTDQKADSNKRKRQKYEEIATVLSGRNSNIKRTGKEVQEKVKNLIKSAKELPHCKKINPTGGGPPLPPLEKEWQKILVEIIRENPATEGLQGGIESGDSLCQIKSALQMGDGESTGSEDTDSDVRPLSTDLPLPSSLGAFAFDGAFETITPTPAKKPRQQPNRTDSPLPKKTLEQAQMELIELEKEKTKLKIEELKDRRKVHSAMLEYLELKTSVLQTQAAVTDMQQQPPQPISGNACVQYLYTNQGHI